MHPTANLTFPDKSTAQDILALFERVTPGPVYSLTQTAQGWKVSVGAHKTKQAGLFGDDPALLPEALVTITLSVIKRTHLTVKVLAGNVAMTINRSMFKSCKWSTDAYAQKKITFTVAHAYAKSKGLLAFVDKETA